MNDTWPRNASIAIAVATGVLQRDLAREYGLSKQRVSQIVRRAGEVAEIEAFATRLGLTRPRTAQEWRTFRDRMAAAGLSLTFWGPR